MFFTQEDYLKIEKWLLNRTIKDTEFNNAVVPLKGTETIALVQNGQNVKTYVKDFVQQLFALGINDFLNVSALYNKKRIALDDAIKLVPFTARKVGQVITFCDEDGNWQIYQYIGESLLTWNNLTLWKDIIQAIAVAVNIVPDEEDVTGVTEGEATVIKFKNKRYDSEEYSGLGRVYLRKNIQTVGSEDAARSTNLLAQSMFLYTNSIYIVQYDYDLNGSIINVPTGSILDFQGGSIDNGTINFPEGTCIRNLYKGTATITGNPTYIDYLADEEDVTTKNGILKFKDKEYSSSDFSGLGRKYLRKNIVEGKNILTQDMVNSSNTIYIIQYDYDLNGQEIIVPENCVLQFEGGSLSNGILVGNKTKINANLEKIFDLNIEAKGVFYITEVYPEWFGTNSEDDSIAINKSIEFAKDTSKIVFLSKDEYIIKEPINVLPNISLIGKEIIASEFVTIRGGVTIKQTSEKHGIIISYKTPYIQNVIIKNINVIYSDESIRTKTNSGIYIGNTTDNIISDTQFVQSLFQNVSVEHFEYGICFKGSSYLGIAYNEFNNIYLQRNKIGLYVESFEGSDGKTQWMNANSFTNLKISNNYIGGIYFKNLSSTEQNNFYSCVIENNGKDYIPEFISDDNIGGYAFRAENNVFYGVVNFVNCYIEGNYLRREGEATDNEYERNGVVYPNNISEIGYIFNIEKCSVLINKCKLSRFIKLINAKLSSISLYSNDYNNAIIDYDEDSNKDKYLISFNVLNKLNVLWLYLYINEDYYLGDKDSHMHKYIDRLLDIPLEDLELLNLDVNIHHPLSIRDIKINRNKNLDYDVYLEEDGNDSGIGLSKGCGIKSLERVDNIASRFNSIVNIRLFGSFYITNNSIYKNYNKIRFIGENSNKPTISRGTITKNIYNDAEFNNIIIRNQSSDLDTSVFNVLGGNSIIFNNCTIQLASARRFLINSNIDSLVVIFNKCNFVLDNSSSGTNFSISNNANIGIITNDCSFNDYTLIIPIKIGTTEQRPTLQSINEGFEYYDSTLKKKILWNGSKWVNLDGTPLE